MSDSRDPEVQGEGDYAAARRYDEKTKRFVDSGRVDDAANDAKPRSAEEESILRDAEQDGLSRSKAPGQ
jgi:hypothetical protein